MMNPLITTNPIPPIFQSLKKYEVINSRYTMTF